MKRTILILASLTILLVASSAQAYVLLSPKRTWASTPVTVEVNNTGNSTINDGSGGANRTASAIGAWSNARGQVVGATATRGDGVPTIMLHDNGRVCTGSCLAATLTGYYHQNGDGSYTIDDADVYTNQRYSYVSEGEADGCSGEFYIEGIMVHEVGHVIGIGHSDVPGSTMYPSVGYCNNDPATLSNDDKSAESDLYSGGGGPGPGCTDADGDGHCSIATGGDDCNDSNNKIYPGANDTKGKQGRDGIDNDCDGIIDG